MQLTISYVTSIEVTETTRRAAVTKGKKDAAADFAALDWHTLSVDETCGRLGVAPEIGLDKVCISSEFGVAFAWLHEHLSLRRAVADHSTLFSCRTWRLAVSPRCAF